MSADDSLTSRLNLSVDRTPNLSKRFDRTGSRGHGQMQPTIPALGMHLPWVTPSSVNCTGLPEVDALRPYLVFSVDAQCSEGRHISLSLSKDYESTPVDVSYPVHGRPDQYHISHGSKIISAGLSMYQSTSVSASVHANRYMFLSWV